MRNREYEALWERHELLRSNEQYAIEQLQEARSERDAAKQALVENGPSATVEERQEMEKQLHASELKVEQKSEQLAEARTAVAQLQLDNPQYAEALENNIPPPESLRDKIEPYVTTTAAAAGIVVSLGTADVPATTSAQHVASDKTIAAQHMEDPHERVPREEGRQMQQRMNQTAREVEDYNRAIDNARSSGPPQSEAVTSATYQGSASFAPQAFSGEEFPHREAANDNNPKGPPPNSGAGALPANDNEQKTSALGSSFVSDEQIARDFAAPPPPPPPPPPPEPELQQGLSR